MGNRNWAMSAVAGSTTSFESLRFKKTGSEVQTAIDGKATSLKAAILASEARIREICKRREVEPTEVIGVDAHETSQKVGAYSTANSERFQAKTAMEKFNADMQQLQSEAWGIDSAQGELALLARVKANIEPERSFDFEYAELVRFGF